MDVLAEALAWFGDPAHWQGTDGVPSRIVQHLQLSGLALVVGLVIALPMGIVIGHTGRGGAVAVAIANIGRAVPSFAILVMVLPLVLGVGLGLGFWPTVVALVVLSVPPILVNTYTGMRGVDHEVVEAARGMGMNERQLALLVELPNALPIVIAGARVAAVQVVATATLGAVVASGGLGRYIVDGFARQEDARILAGAILVAALAIVTDQLFGLIERRGVSPGIRGRRRPRAEQLTVAAR
ncbi:MAG: ABC transporter permease [Candidatus Limnocylindria bacterium]